MREGWTAETLVENDLRRWFRASWIGWLSFIEAAPGGTPGLPDMLVGIDGIFSMELKVGSMVMKKTLRARIEPTQVAWHREAAKAGIRSGVLIGVGTEKLFNTFLIRGDAIAGLIDGMDIGVKELVKRGSRIDKAISGDPLFTQALMEKVRSL